jgi:hypothetical protein
MALRYELLPVCAKETTHVQTQLHEKLGAYFRNKDLGLYFKPKVTLQHVQAKFGLDNSEIKPVIGTRSSLAKSESSLQGGYK